jgi:site-specific recombinase XerC
LAGQLGPGLSSRAAACLSTHMHSGGTDLRVLQELLGHAGIETSQIYTHLDASRLHQMVRDLHPLNDGQEIAGSGQS